MLINTRTGISDPTDSTVVASVQTFSGINRLMVDSTSSGSSVAAPLISRQDENVVVTSTGNSAVLDTAGMGCLSVDFNITAVSGTLPTLDLEIEVSEDGTNFFHLFTMPRVTAATNVRAQAIRCAGRYYRIKKTVSGTLPSFTYTLQTTLKAYLPNKHSVFIRYNDLNFTALNNTSTVFRASDVSNISVMLVIGAGGATGRYRVQGSNDNSNFADVTSDITIVVGGVTLTTISNQAFRYYRLIVTNLFAVGDTTADVFWGSN